MNKLLLTLSTLTIIATSAQAEYQFPIKKQCISLYNSAMILESKMNNIQKWINKNEPIGVQSKNAYIDLSMTRFSFYANYNKFIYCNEGKIRKHYDNFKEDGIIFYSVKVNEAKTKAEKEHFNKKLNYFIKL